MRPEPLRLPCLIALWVIAFSACKHQCPDGPPPHYTFLADDLHYFDFPVGAWWVYVNDSTGQRDSVYLTQKYDSLATYYDEAGECVTGTGDFKVTHFNSAVWNYDCQFLGYVMNDGWALGCFYIGNIGIFSFVSPIVPGYSSNSSIWKNGDFDSLNVGGNWYYDVHLYKSLVRLELYADYDTANFIYAKNIGLISWNISRTDTSWRLVNHGGQ